MKATNCNKSYHFEVFCYDWFDEIAKKSTTHEHEKFDLCQSSSNNYSEKTLHSANRVCPNYREIKTMYEKINTLLERSVHLVNHNIYNFLSAIWQKKYMVLSNFSATHFFMMLIVVNNFTKSQKHNVYWNKQFCDRHELVLCITCKFQYILKCSDQLFLFSWIFYPCWFMRSYGLKYIVIAHHVWIADRHNIYQFLNLITRQNVL